MSLIDDYKKGDISRHTLLTRAKDDPALMAEVTALFGEPLSEDELESIAAAGIKGTSNNDTLTGTAGDDDMDGFGGDDTMHGGDGNDSMGGGDGNDTMYGGAGRDVLTGGDGSDILYGGSGNDYISGGTLDGEDDIAYGGTGNDAYFWDRERDGSDTFDGGSGSDVIFIGLNEYGATLQGQFNDGTIQITLSTEDGEPIEITDDMWVDGQLHLPEGCTGIITGPTGETLTFKDVEIIRNY